MKRTNRIIINLIAGLLTMLSILLESEVIVIAQGASSGVKGKLYQFGEKDEYNTTSGASSSTILGDSQFGTFTVSGEINSIANKNGYEAYEVKGGTVTFSYEIKSSFVNAAEMDWHLIDDKSTKVNSIKLEDKLQKGAIIVQTSIDGNIWVTDTIITNMAGEKSSFEKNFYNSRGVQQVNGCYYRVIVAYKMEKRLEDTKLGPITQKHYDYQKTAEVYEFYLIDSYEYSGKSTNPDATPKKELGKKIKTAKDKGFSGEEAITNKDPHFGWDIGSFYLNGYTREQPVTGSEDPVFLKSLGDRVTLWFLLKQDITKLNGNKDFSINEDVNGYDQYFGVPQTNFKHGTLIIQFTDYEGKTHEPVIYTDFLAANAITNENTKVELFEEGDYEVALDYEIKDSSGLLDSYTNYRIYFRFRIRNANCMVFPFDLKTGAELSDQAFAENGFKLDLAKSRYLIIDIVRSTVKMDNGRYLLDARVSTATQEGKEYTAEGVYTFTVKNIYTDDSQTKTIYVGSKPIYKALAGGESLENINELLEQGGELQEDGSIQMPVLEITEEPEEIEAPKVVEEVESKETETVQETQVTTSQPSIEEDEHVEEEDEIKPSNYVWVFVIIGIVITVLGAGAYFMLRIQKRGLSVSQNGANDQEKEDEVI